jgi:hypothetical protein
MLLNLSHNYSEKRSEIERSVGKPFDLETRKKLDGSSLRDVPITAASIDLYNLLVLNEAPTTCNLEMRTKGLIISFQVKKDTYSLVIPYYKLKIYKGRAEEYSFYKDKYFIKILAGAKEKEIHAFVKKLRHYKADQALPRIEDEP